MDSFPVGIDLGTTHSLLSVFLPDGTVRLIGGADGSVLTPSAVSLSDDGTLLVGAAAFARHLSHPDTTHVAFKRHIGTGKIFRLGNHSYTATDLSALVLRKLREDFEAVYPGAVIGDLVISVPAYFSSAQREATMLAADLAGLPVPRLVNEPTAAALAYGLAEREGERTFIVLDLGGGTFDVSIIEMFDGVIEVRASSGDAMLGGEDFTDIIGQEIGRRLGLDPGAMTAGTRAHLYTAAEALKRHLSRAESGEVTLSLPGSAPDSAPDTETRVAMTRTEFEALAAPLLLRLRRPIERSLYDAKVTVDRLDRVILVGGATRMPMIRGLAARMLRKLPESGLNPDEVVARGAAVQAALLHRNAALDDLVMTDVAPFSLGIKTRLQTAHGVLPDAFQPIIERNTTLPASRVQSFWTVANDQEQIAIEVYQGEAPLAAENVLIGTTSIPVPPAPAGQEGVSVRFSYDASGLLHVRVEVISNKETREMVIEGRASTMPAEEKAQRLKALGAYMHHPREEAVNIGLIERLKSLYAMLLGEDRAYVSDMLARFERAMEGQDPKEIAHLRKELEAEIARIDASYVR